VTFTFTFIPSALVTALSAYEWKINTAAAMNLHPFSFIWQREQMKIKICQSIMFFAQNKGRIFFFSI
jgi:hypothetical protein